MGLDLVLDSARELARVMVGEDQQDLGLAVLFQAECRALDLELS